MIIFIFNTSVRIIRVISRIIIIIIIIKSLFGSNVLISFYDAYFYNMYKMIRLVTR